MRANRTRITWIAALIVAWPVLQSFGQSRNQVNMSTPGSLSNVGSSGSSNSFRAFSYGLGSLGSPGGPGTHALRSSIYDSGMNIRRSGALAPPSGLSGYTSGVGLMTGPPASSGLGAPRTTMGSVGGALDMRVGRPLTDIRIAPPSRPPGLKITDGASPLTGATAPPSFAPIEGEPDETTLGSAKAYLLALEESTTSRLKDRTEPITTLVPTAPSMYQEHMLKADRAFRRYDFHKALTEYLIANDVGRNDPESLLCLAHTHFALARYSYAKPAYFLRRAVKRMPELPLANLRPRGFYDSPSKYAEHMYALEQEHLKRRPYDGDALLVLAYFRWFEQTRDVEAIRDALSKSLADALKSRNTDLAEAVETFWDGMVATGSVSGKLIPAGSDEAGVAPR